MKLLLNIIRKKVVKKIYPIILLIIVAFSVFAQEQKTVRINDYKGILGEKQIGLAITIDGEESLDESIPKGISDVYGAYFYVDVLQDIPIKGTLNGRDIILNELDPNDGHIISTFKGHFLANNPEGEDCTIDIMAGTWIQLEKNKSKTFKVSLFQIVTAINNNRYYETGFSDPKIVEIAAQKFKAAVLEKDKLTVASLIHYPIEVDIKNKAIKIMTNKQFIKLYDEIFKGKFLDTIKKSIPHNMFTRDGRVMLCEGGAVWFRKVNNTALVDAIIK